MAGALGVLLALVVVFVYFLFPKKTNQRQRLSHFLVLTFSDKCSQNVNVDDAFEFRQKEKRNLEKWSICP